MPVHEFLTVDPAAAAVPQNAALLPSAKSLVSMTGMTSM